MRIIIDTEEQYLPAFREVAKLVRAKVKVERDEPNSIAKPGEKIADLLEKLAIPEDAISFESVGRTEPTSQPVKRSDFRGSISKEMAQELRQHVEQARQEWDRAI